MKVFIFICVVSSFFVVANGIKCLFALPNTPAIKDYICDNGDDFCMTADFKVNGTELKIQGCGNVLNGTTGFPDKCTGIGTSTINTPGMTGQYNCCNGKDNCNDNISLDPDATNGIKCILTLPNASIVKDFPCGRGIDFCMTADFKINGTKEVKIQGCGNVLNGTYGFPDKCTGIGTSTINTPGMTGQYNCCNGKDNCNDNISLNPDALNGIKCILASPNAPVVKDFPCGSGIDFCMTADYKINGVEMKIQGCGNVLNGTYGFPDKCTKTGTTTFNSPGVTGQYNCCNDKDNCNENVVFNSDAPNKSAAKSFAFCLIMLSIFVSLLW